MKLFTLKQKVQFKKFTNRLLNFSIVLLTLLVGFWVGFKFNQISTKPQTINEVILNKEVRVAIDAEDKLILMDRKTGQYVIYSDSIGKSIFRIYASKIINTQDAK